eukprot:COSAG04_NODE_522_length_13154_cov_27.623592_1_plen_26_part_10
MLAPFDSPSLGSMPAFILPLAHVNPS